MGNPIQIVSTAAVKKIEDMTIEELKIAVSDLLEVHEYLTRADAGFEEICFADDVAKQIEEHRSELAKRVK